jgi:hypothetical protein
VVEGAEAGARRLTEGEARTRRGPRCGTGGRGARARGRAGTPVGLHAPDAAAVGERALGAAGGAAAAALNSALAVLGGLVLILFLTLLTWARAGTGGAR